MTDILTSPRFCQPMFEYLKSVPVIGWDFDATLHLGVNADLMHAFIQATPEKTHYIVTYRSHGLQHDVWRDLEGDHPDTVPDQSCFAGVVNVPDEMYEAWAELERVRRINPGMPKTKPVLEFEQWKGKMCKKLGIQVLIDDMTSTVKSGCDRYGIRHIHPEDL